MNNILNTILKDTYTLSALNHRLNILKSFLLDTLFGNMQKQNLEPIDSSWLKKIPADFLQNFNKDNVYQVFKMLDWQKTQLKLLTMYLPFDPDTDTVNLIGPMVRKMFGNLILLDIKYDPKLIAGTALVWKGIYRSYSLSSQIEQKNGEILDMFKKYLKK